MQTLSIKIVQKKVEKVVWAMKFHILVINNNNNNIL